jgi:hypothetical protein
MYKLFTDKKETFTCKVDLEGVSRDNTQVRLVIEGGVHNTIYYGKIASDNTCQIAIPKLKNVLSEGSKGHIKLEVIADDTYFVPWESEYQVQVAKKVQVEVVQPAQMTQVNESRVEVQVEQSSRPKVATKSVNHASILAETFSRANINKKNALDKVELVTEIVRYYLEEYKVSLDVNELFAEIYSKLP